jgi:hypothetical protein
MAGEVFAQLRKIEIAVSVRVNARIAKGDWTTADAWEESSRAVPTISAINGPVPRLKTREKKASSSKTRPWSREVTRDRGV